MTVMPENVWVFDRPKPSDVTNAKIEALQAGAWDWNIIRPEGQTSGLTAIGRSRIDPRFVMTVDISAQEVVTTARFEIATRSGRPPELICDSDQPLTDLCRIVIERGLSSYRFHPLGEDA